MSPLAKATVFYGDILLVCRNRVPFFPFSPSASTTNLAEGIAAESDNKSVISPFISLGTQAKMRKQTVHFLGICIGPRTRTGLPSPPDQQRGTWKTANEELAWQDSRPACAKLRRKDGNRLEFPTRPGIFLMGHRCFSLCVCTESLTAKLSWSSEREEERALRARFEALLQSGCRKRTAERAFHQSPSAPLPGSIGSRTFATHPYMHVNFRTRSETVKKVRLSQSARQPIRGNRTQHAGKRDHTLPACPFRHPA